MSETPTPPPPSSEGSGPTQPASKPTPRLPYRADQLPRDGKPVSFYLAIFLALLLFVSGGLNLLLLFVSALGSAAGDLTGSSYSDAGDGMYEIVRVSGDANATDRLLRVPVSGPIAEAQTPVLGAAGGTVSQIRRALRTAARDDSIKGVLLDINSPGGGVTDSDEIWRIIQKFRTEHEKPVLALFGDIAASGGYYIAAACDEIVCRPTSITGSIGVIMQNFNIAEAADNLGIKQETIISEDTPYKDILSMFRPMKPEERAILGSIVDELYERFVKVVAGGRPALEYDRVRELADGRVYSAQQALNVGLVDAVEDLDAAIARLEALCDISSSSVVEQRRRPSFSELLLGARGPRTPSIERAAASLLTATSGPRFLYFWAGAR